MDTFRTAAVFTADVSTEGANQKIAVLGIFWCPRLICLYLNEFCTDWLETWIDNSG
jgi:hypothetical protein